MKTRSLQAPLLLFLFMLAGCASIPSNDRPNSADEPPLTSYPKLLNKKEITDFLNASQLTNERQDLSQVKVKVEIHIIEDGKVERSRIALTSGQRDFDRAALSAAKRMIFSPAMVGDKPVKCFIHQWIHFNSTEGEYLFSSPGSYTPRRY